MKKRHVKFVQLRAKRRSKRFLKKVFAKKMKKGALTINYFSNKPIMCYGKAGKDLCWKIINRSNH